MDHISEIGTKWGPQTIAKLVYNSNVTMVYGTYNYSIHGVYKPSFHHWGGPHCMWYNHFHQPWVLTGHEVHRSGDVRW